MKEVTKAKFKEVYFGLGGSSGGWNEEYWDQFFENDPRPGMKYIMEEPQSPDHNRMMIVSDFSINEYRLFFLTEESEESFFEFPDSSETV